MKNPKYILITGCSSGIGKACAIHLVQQGYEVFAGVRRTADGEALQSLSLKKLHPVFSEFIWVIYPANRTKTL